MINKDQLRKYVIRPTLKYLDLWSESAEDLLMGTSAQESQLGTYLHQLGNGPALGIYQMEPATQKDIWENFLAYRPDLKKKISDISAIKFMYEGDNQMMWNLAYATAMCRIHYLRVPEALPAYNNLEAYAAYWKKYYNTPLGAGTEKEFVENYRKYVS